MERGIVVAKGKTRAEKRRDIREAKAGTMVLTLRECFGLLAVLPRQGDLLTGRIIMDLLRNLSPTEEDIKEASIKQAPSGGVSWDTAMMDTIKKVVPIGEKAKEIIATGIGQASAKRAIDFQWLDLYGKFVELPPLPEPEQNGHKETESE